MLWYDGLPVRSLILMTFDRSLFNYNKIKNELGNGILTHYYSNGPKHKYKTDEEYRTRFFPFWIKN